MGIVRGTYHTSRKSQPKAPFEDASFDRVTSTFGAMFTPDQRPRGRRAGSGLPPGGGSRHDERTHQHPKPRQPFSTTPSRYDATATPT